LDGLNRIEARGLYKQLKERNKEIELPIYIQLKGLELDETLRFKLTEESVYKTAECLKWEGGVRGEIYYSKIDEHGLPVEEDKNSSRAIYTQKGDLASMSLYRFGNLGSRSRDLFGSGLDESFVVILEKVGGSTK
jgi:hypothetical protein